MGELQFQLSVKDGQAQFKIHTNKANALDISLAIANVEMLKTKLIEQLQQQSVETEFRHDKKPGDDE